MWNEHKEQNSNIWTLVLIGKEIWQHSSQGKQLKKREENSECVVQLNGKTIRSIFSHSEKIPLMLSYFHHYNIITYTLAQTQHMYMVDECEHKT